MGIFTNRSYYKYNLGWIIDRLKMFVTDIENLKKWQEENEPQFQGSETYNQALQSFFTKRLAIIGDSNAMAAGLAGGMKTIFADWFPDMTVDNYAQSGSGFLYKNAGNNYMEQSDLLTGNEDYVIIWTGYNDKTLYSTPDILGSYAYESLLNGINTGTLLGAVKYTLLNVKTKCPNAKIVVITKPTINALPNTYDEALRNSYKAICDIYNVGFINANSHCTILQSDMLDSLHFNENCLYRKIAPLYIMAMLNGGDAVDYYYPSLLVPLNAGASTDNVKATMQFLATMGLASVSVPLRVNRLISWDGTGNYGADVSIQSGSLVGTMAAGSVFYACKVLNQVYQVGTITLQTS